jgi:putative MATE family efflux protein
VAENVGILATIRESLTGSGRDYTEGNLNRAVIILAIPMILEMLMESLFGIVDMFFVARLGVDSLATVALTESCIIIVFGVAIGLSMATTAFVARRIGEKDPEGAAVAAVQSIIVGILLAAVVSVTGVLLAPTMLSIMGASAGVVHVGATYARILLGGSLTIFLLFLINAVFRGAGDPALSMRALWFANIINIVLDPIFIHLWGVKGAAIATTTGRSLGVIFQLWMLFGGHSRIHLHARHVRVNLKAMWDLLKVAANGMMQELISSASWTGLIRICSSFGSTPVAAYTVAIKIFMFVILPVWGLSNSAATLVGQNLGAKKPERAEAAVYRTGIYGTYYMASIGLLVMIFAPGLAGFFTPDPEVRALAAQCLRIISVGNISYAWSLAFLQAFNGAGDTKTPSIMSFFCYWCFQFPAAWALAMVLGFGPRGVFMAIPAAETAMTISALILFRGGKWKHKVL